MNENVSTSSGYSALASMKSLGASSVCDTISSRRHSRDFSFARSHYLRSRVVVVGLIFLALTPFWAIFDHLMLPESAQHQVLLARGAMVGGLLVTLLLAHYCVGRARCAQIVTGLIIALPALFYAAVLAALPADWSGELLGYSFIPFMLTVMLCIFPFTLLESFIFGLGLLILQAFAQHVSGSWLSAQGIQEMWLLSALLFITLAANYFHLSLLLRLYREATHDPLTGLLNRGALIQSLAQVRAPKSNQPMALLMMDLDHFKRINDDHGHSVGDKVLRQFAQLLRNTITHSDFAARYGGEEFVAVLTNTDKNAAIAVAEQLRRQVEAAPITDHEGATFNFTVSIGVATLYPDEPFDTAARRADDRLYEAKKTARNCVVGV